MPVFDSRAVTTVVIGVFTAAAIAVLSVGFVERSSDAALAEFMSAGNVSASDPGPSGTNGKTGCPVGKKELPTRLIPFR